MGSFIDLREAIRKFPSLPEGEERDMLNRVIFKAINKLTGLSGMTTQEWRAEFLKGKRNLTWGDFRSPDDVPEFNILQEDVFEAAHLRPEHVERLRAYLIRAFGEGDEPNREVRPAPPPEFKPR